MSPFARRICVLSLERIDFVAVHEVLVPVYDRLAEVGPRAVEVLVGLDLLLGAQAAVIDAPAGELLPAVQRHGWRADHDLVELMRHGIAVGC